MKLAQTSISIAQTHPEHEPAITAAWPAKVLAEATTAAPETSIMNSNGHPPDVNNAAVLDTSLQSNMLEDLAYDADLLGWDPTSMPAWWEDNVDIFSDFGGYQSKPAAILTGWQ